MRELRSRLRDARRRAGDDSGMTLTELLVSMIVFSMSMALIMGAVTVVVGITKEAQGASDAVFATRQALATIDRQVRSGNVLFSPADEVAYISTCQDLGTNKGSCMRIFTQSNGDEKCVQWQMAPDGAGSGLYKLQMRSWETTWQTGGSVTGWGVVARGLTMSDAPFELDVGAGNIYGERLLKVHLVARNADTGRDVAIDASISGRNTSYGYTGSQCTPVPPV
ncbi:prepilin cleavage protein [Cellulomonas sp. Root485]|uniref:PulJ/GspJ family protein n=1 Tax=Cellulomonas sp. Root485 TaxID=1736546 RepID=UPI0006F59A82|nr:type II secretion system protein [Cellulomonas sp. Root485]KQY25099.1 prepilin cleavage protein [Cellulomonas sp. Root485]